VESLTLPYTSPFCSRLEVVLRFQGHEFNLDPSSTYYSDLFTYPFRMAADEPTFNTEIYSVSALHNYVDNPLGVLPEGGTYETFNPITSAIWNDCSIRFRLKDSSGTIIDPASGSGWAVTLSHEGGGLRPGEGMGSTDRFPVREVALSLAGSAGAVPYQSPRALEYGTKARTGEGVTLEIGYEYARPLSVTVSEIPPTVVATSNFVYALFPAWPTSQPSANEPDGVQEVYYYSGHIYIQFKALSTATNGLVFMPEPPTSSWPFSGMGLSSAATSGNSDFDVSACASNQFEYQSECYGASVGGELDRIGASAAGFSGVPVPGDSSTQNNWTTAPASNPEWPNMGEFALRAGGQVWHSTMGTYPDHLVIVSANQPFTIEGSARLPVGTERAFVRFPVSAVTSWDGSLSVGDAKGATAFTIYDSTTSQQGTMYHAQESEGGPAAELKDFFGLGANAYILGILEGLVNLDAVKAEMDSMGIP